MAAKKVDYADYAKTTKERLIEKLEEVEKERDRLKSDISKLKKYEKYEETADELGAMRDAFVNSGFTDDQAFQIIITLVQKLHI